MVARPGVRTRRGCSMYVSGDWRAREEEVCGVRPVEVREAAARPVVWRAEL